MDKSNPFEIMYRRWLIQCSCFDSKCMVLLMRQLMLVLSYFVIFISDIRSSNLFFLFVCKLSIWYYSSRSIIIVFSWHYGKVFVPKSSSLLRISLLAADGADQACINWCTLNIETRFNDSDLTYKNSRFNFLEMCFVFGFSCRNMQMSCCCRWWLFMHKILWFNVLYIGGKYLGILCKRSTRKINHQCLGLDRLDKFSDAVILLVANAYVLLYFRSCIIWQ